MYLKMQFERKKFFLYPIVDHFIGAKICFVFEPHIFACTQCGWRYIYTVVVTCEIFQKFVVPFVVITSETFCIMNF